VKETTIIVEAGVRLGVAVPTPAEIDTPGEPEAGREGSELTVACGVADAGAVGRLDEDVVVDILGDEVEMASEVPLELCDATPVMPAELDGDADLELDGDDVAVGDLSGELDGLSRDVGLLVADGERDSRAEIELDAKPEVVWEAGPDASGEREEDGDLEADLLARPEGDTLEKGVRDGCKDTVESAECDSTADRLRRDDAEMDASAVLDAALNEGALVGVATTEALLDVVPLTEGAEEDEAAVDALDESVFTLTLAIAVAETAVVLDDEREGDRLARAETLAAALSLGVLVERASEERLDDRDAELLIEGEAVTERDTLEEKVPAGDGDEDIDRRADAENDGDDFEVRDADAHSDARGDSVVCAVADAEAQFEEVSDKSDDRDMRGDLDTLGEVRALGDTESRGLSEGAAVFDAWGVSDAFTDDEADVDTLREIGGDRDALAELLSRPLGCIETDAERDTREDGDTRAEPDADRDADGERETDTEGVSLGVSVGIDGLADAVAVSESVCVAEGVTVRVTSAVDVSVKETRADSETLPEMDIDGDIVGEIRGDFDPEANAETDGDREKRVLTLSVVVKLMVADDESDATDAEKDALGVGEALADGENVTTDAVAERDITEDKVPDGDTIGVNVCETDRV
jgi:hypothetical protein